MAALSFETTQLTPQQFSVIRSFTGVRFVQRTDENKEVLSQLQDHRLVGPLGHGGVSSERFALTILGQKVFQELSATFKWK